MISVGDETQRVNRDILSNRAEPTASPAAVEVPLPFVPDADYTRRMKEQLAEFATEGIAFVPILFGEKRPTRLIGKDWGERDYTAGDFDATEYGIGIKLGFASNCNRENHSLICLDFDSREALEAARGLLPHTDMRDGRPGNEESHSFYLIDNNTLPDWAVANAPGRQYFEKAKRLGIPRHPRSFDFKCPKRAGEKAGKKVIEFKGGGAQVAAHPSPTKYGLRSWTGGRMGKPRIAPFDEVFAPVCHAAVKVGAELPKEIPNEWRQKHGLPLKAEPVSAKVVGTPNDSPADRPTTLTAVVTTEPARSRCADSLIADDYRRWLQTWIQEDGPPLNGQDAAWLSLPESEHRGGGNNLSYGKACAGRIDFDLPPELVWSVFDEVVNGALRAGAGKAGYTVWEREQFFGIMESAEKKREADAGQIGCKRICRNPSACGCGRGKSGTRNTSEHDDDKRCWDDPLQLARLLSRLRTCLFIRDMGYVYESGRWVPLSDERIRAWAVKLYTDEAAKELERRERQWKANGNERRLTEAKRRAAELRKQVEQLPSLEGAEAEALLKRCDTAEQQETALSAKQPRSQGKFKSADCTATVLAFKALNQQDDDKQPLDVWLSGANRPKVLACANGLLDPHTGKLYDHDSDWLSLFGIPTPYDPTAPQPEKFLRFIGQVTQGDASKAARLQEIAGACLDPFETYKFFAALLGDGDNGKSVFLHVLTLVLGAESVSNIGIDELGSDRPFAGFELRGRLANITPDQGALTIKDLGRLKNATGGDRFKYEAKGKQPVFGTVTAKIIAAFNELPPLNDRSSGIWKRLIVVLFSLNLKDGEKNPALMTSEYWTEELPGILNWMLAGLHRLRLNGKAFTPSAASDQFRDQHRSDSNTARGFLAENVEAGNTTDFIPSDSAYTLFRDQALRDGEQSKYLPTLRVFSAEFGKLFATAVNCKRRLGGLERRGFSGVKPKCGTTLAVKVAEEMKSNDRKAPADVERVKTLEQLAGMASGHGPPA